VAICSLSVKEKELNPESSHLFPLQLVDQLRPRGRTLGDRRPQQRHGLCQEAALPVGRGAAVEVGGG
jgi:hypothetical protein